MKIFHKSSSLSTATTTAFNSIKSSTPAYSKLYTTTASHTSYDAFTSATLFSIPSLPTKKMFFLRQSLLISLLVLFFLCTLQIDLIRGAFEDGNNNNVKITKHSLELTQTLNLQRQEYLQKQCYNLGYSMLDLTDLTEEQMDHMIVDQEHKLLYCYVPKVSLPKKNR